MRPLTLFCGMALALFSFTFAQAQGETPKDRPAGLQNPNQRPSAIAVPT